MNTDEKKKIAELEKDIKKMQKDHRRTFAEFEHKKSLSERVTDRLKDIYSIITVKGPSFNSETFISAPKMPRSV